MAGGSKPGRRMARGIGKDQADQGEAARQPCPPSAFLSLVRLLARQAAREALRRSVIEQENTPNDDED